MTDDRTEPAASRQTATREKQLVALWSVLAAVFLTAMKLVAGIMTNSLGIIAEAAHSGLDLLAAALTLIAVRLSGRPADLEHPYGHHKLENLSALVETLLLLATCGWIVHEAIQRLFHKDVHLDPSFWAFAVMGISIVVDISRSRSLARTARKHKSQALEADALHFSTDVWSSAVVIVGLILVLLNNQFGPNPILERADTVAALIVAAIVVWVSLRLGKRTVDALLDRAPVGLAQEIAGTAKEVPGVLDCYRLRLREAGEKIFVDLIIAVSRNLSFEQTHEIATLVEERIRGRVPRTDVVVHVEPVEEDTESITESLHAVAKRLGLGIHDVAVYELRSRFYVDLHLEVDENLNLHDAHAVASTLEREFHKEVPAIAAINTHLESFHKVVTHRHDVTTAAAAVVRTVKEVARAVPGLRDCHNVIVREAQGRMVVSFHCTFDGSTPIKRIHEASTLIEDRLKAALPRVERVVVHAEPA
jgi:cation diffusion facilitator family transporter